MIFGSVAFFDASKGFGFLTRDDGEPDAFVHIKELSRCGLATLTAGQKVKYDVKDANGKSLRAIDIAIVD